MASALPDASVAALAARTEGWAAGLQLAALSLRGHDDAAAFVAAFTGSHRYVLDYLAEEVLEGQDEQLRTFLLETSVLDRLSGPLCNAVTGREGSQTLLEEAERAGLFLIPLDEVRGWWRYHHLFADLLRARLQAARPGPARAGARPAGPAARRGGRPGPGRQPHRDRRAAGAGLAVGGEEAAAVTVLAGALLLACPQGHVRVFADEGPPMAALLGRLIAAQRAGRAAAGVPLGYLARLQRAFCPGQPASGPVPAGIVDPLTGRELEVLKMMAAGRSNQAIACELVVTLDTVKKHVGHVLGKLGAANRTEAVARARELSPIP